MSNTTTINLAIDNLNVISDALQKAADDDKNYNTSFSHYLEQMAFEARKMSSELRETSYMIGW